MAFDLAHAEMPFWEAVIPATVVVSFSSFIFTPALMLNSSPLIFLVSNFILAPKLQSLIFIAANDKNYNCTPAHIYPLTETNEITRIYMLKTECSHTFNTTRNGNILVSLKTTVEWIS